MNAKLTNPEAQSPDRMLEKAIAAVRHASDKGKPFIIEWRLTDAHAQYWQGNGEAGCACGGGSLD
jgi:hypothetical protein